MGKYDLAAATSLPPVSGVDEDYLRAVENDESEELDLPDSWLPLDLGPYVRGEVTPPQPTIGIARTDGLQLLYPGREHAVVGEMESGKSWLALACVAAELAAGRAVVYVHFEESDPSGTVERLRALGVSAELITTRLRFVAPERVVQPGLLLRLFDPPPSLVVLDGVNEAMAMNGWDIRAEDGAAAYRLHLVRPCVRAGAAVLSCDHVTKSVEGRGRYGIGSVHKGNGLSGSLILLENLEPFGRTRRGRSRVFVTKDRPGALRQHGQADRHVTGKSYLGELVVDDSQLFGPDLTLRLFAPSTDADEQQDDNATGALADVVLEVLGGQGESTVGSKRALLAALRVAGHQLRDVDVRDAVDDLVARGQVAEVSGRRGAIGYRVVTTASQTGEPSAEPRPS